MTLGSGGIRPIWFVSRDVQNILPHSTSLNISGPERQECKNMRTYVIYGYGG